MWWKRVCAIHKLRWRPETRTRPAEWRLYKRALTINVRGARPTAKESEDDPNSKDSASPYKPVSTIGRPDFKTSTSPLSLHDSLASFLEYASKSNLSTTSTVFRGTKYEYTCLETLASLGFSLERIGGANDAGIDLIGSWNLPTFARPIRTLVQSKFLVKKSVSPVLVRELEGAYLGMPMDGEDLVIGILCTPSLATKAVRDAIRRSTKPIILATIDAEGWLEAMTWNTAVQEICENVTMGMRYVDGRKQAILLVNNQPWTRTEGE